MNDRSSNREELQNGALKDAAAAVGEDNGDAVGHQNPEVVRVMPHTDGPHARANATGVICAGKPKPAVVSSSIPSNRMLTAVPAGANPRFVVLLHVHAK